MSEQVKLGPTGDFPQGKLNEADEGGLKIAIGRLNGKVVVNFGTPVGWFGMPPEMAEGFAMAILEQAEALKKKNRIIV